ncbi:hypothetical protein VDGE_21323 [Verticillium dahliae]|uniref:Uncharacterized protein n=3 Tax=Verticillium TaxID=1036719 RepID=A0A444RU39_VERDA|nr:hypothetical protein VDGE_21323 [Verticillium dahliae]
MTSKDTMPHPIYQRTFAILALLLNSSLSAASKTNTQLLPRDDEPGLLSRLDKGERIAVGVGIAIGVVLIVIGSIWCCCWPCRPVPRPRSPDRFHRHEGAAGADPEQAQVDGGWVVQRRGNGGRAELADTSDELNRVHDPREAPPPYESGGAAKDGGRK